MMIAVRFFLLVALYFLPTLIAIVVRRQGARHIAITNLLAGWTGIGWAICLAVALYKPIVTLGEVSSPAEYLTHEGRRLHEDLQGLAIAERYVAEKTELVGILDAAERTAQEISRILIQKFIPAEIALDRFEGHRQIILREIHHRIRSASQALTALTALLRNATSQSAIDADPTFQETVRRFSGEKAETRELLADYSRFLAELAAIDIQDGRQATNPEDLRDRREQVAQLAKRLRQIDRN